MIPSHHRIVVALAALICAPALAAEHVSARLISDHEAIARGTPFRIGVHFVIPERAHIYWVNPGESGLPTDVVWTLPENFHTEPLQWPNPKSFRDEVLGETSFGYERQVLLFALVHPPFTLNAGERVTIRAHASWLVCLEDGACIPEDASLAIEIRTAQSPEMSRDAERFDADAGRTPTGVANAAVPLTVDVAGEPTPQVRVSLKPPWHVDDDATEFFPYRGDPWKVEPDTNANSVEFSPTGAVDASPRGALTLALVDPKTGERSTVYVRIGSPAED